MMGVLLVGLFLGMLASEIMVFLKPLDPESDPGV